MDSLFAVCQLESGSLIPPWAPIDNVFSITRTSEVLSIIRRLEVVPEGVVCEPDRRCLRVAGAVPFTVVGVLS